MKRKGRTTEVERVKRRKEKVIRRVKSRLKWAIAWDFIVIALYQFWYKLLYRNHDLEWSNLKPLLNTPQKAFAFFTSCVSIINEPNSGEGISSPESVLLSRRATDKSMAFLYANLLYDHGYRTYVFWCGYRGGFMYPCCCVIDKNYTRTLGVTYKVHFGDQFQIMRDYIPDGSTWKVVNKSGSAIIMSYMKDRREFGSSDIIVYDKDYWMKTAPLAYDLMSKMKFSKGDVDVRGY